MNSYYEDIQSNLAKAGPAAMPSRATKQNVSALRKNPVSPNQAATRPGMWDPNTASMYNNSYHKGTASQNMTGSQPGSLNQSRAAGNRAGNLAQLGAGGSKTGSFVQSGTAGNRTGNLGQLSAGGNRTGNLAQPGTAVRQPGSLAGSDQKAGQQKTNAHTDIMAPQHVRAGDSAGQASAAQEVVMRKQQEFEQWRIQETERLEHKKQKLNKQKKQIEKEWLQLDLEKRHFLHQQEFDATRKKNEEHLLEMKRQILENELYKLAEERKQFEQKKSFYKQVDSYQKEDIRKKPTAIHGAIFFAGVNSQSAVKKRYKDLLKIYHPDNKCGDTDTIQEINREYQRLLESMKGK